MILEAAMEAGALLQVVREIEPHIYGICTVRYDDGRHLRDIYIYILSYMYIGGSLVWVFECLSQRCHRKEGCL